MSFEAGFGVTLASDVWLPVPQTVSVNYDIHGQNDALDIIE